MKLIVQLLFGAYYYSLICKDYLAVIANMLFVCNFMGRLDKYAIFMDTNRKHQ